MPVHSFEIEIETYRYDVTTYGFVHLVHHVENESRFG